MLYIVIESITGIFDCCDTCAVSYISNWLVDDGLLMCEGSELPRLAKW